LSIHCTFVSVNRRNNDSQAHIATWAGASLFHQTYTESVPLKYGKLATKSSWIYGYFTMYSRYTLQHSVLGGLIVTLLWNMSSVYSNQSTLRRPHMMMIWIVVMLKFCPTNELKLPVPLNIVHNYMTGGAKKGNEPAVGQKMCNVLVFHNVMQRHVYAQTRSVRLVDLLQICFRTSCPINPQQIHTIFELTE